MSVCCVHERVRLGDTLLYSRKLTEHCKPTKMEKKKISSIGRIQKYDVLEAIEEMGLGKE